ncbi:hypothetical protein B0H13DRAFT_2535963 [Mycena leptocephala]|nr:hypothetical protein B0H13DRAFT_2535963 [Mycena leptocephala]
MHITSTINAKTQSTDDIPVVLVRLEGNNKFLPRPETYKEMQRLVRDHYEIDSRAGLQFEVSTWDVCAGRDVEVTEAAYPFLAPLLDIVSVVVVEAGRDRAMPTPSATPPLSGDDEIEDEQVVREHLEPERSPGRATESPPRRVPKVEPEDESERRVQSRYDNEGDADGSVSVQDDEEEDAPHARQVLDREFPSARVQAKAKAAPKPRGEPSKTPLAPAPVPGKSRGAANRSEDTAKSSDTDERFKVYIEGPLPHHKADFMTRGGHLVRKVLSGVCKTFELDIEHSRLMLVVPMPDEDGEMVEHLFECANDETIARSGVKPDSKLVVRNIEHDELDEDED